MWLVCLEGGIKGKFLGRSKSKGFIFWGAAMHDNLPVILRNILCAMLVFWPNLMVLYP